MTQCQINISIQTNIFCLKVLKLLNASEHLFGLKKLFCLIIGTFFYNFSQKSTLMYKLLKKVLILQILRKLETPLQGKGCTRLHPHQQSPRNEKLIVVLKILNLWKVTFWNHGNKCLATLLSWAQPR